MDLNNGISVDGYRVQCQVLTRGNDYRVQLTTRKRLAGLREERIVRQSSPLIFESQEEAARHARHLMKAIKRVGPSGKPQFTVI
jgi:hypothetical protein